MYELHQLQNKLIDKLNRHRAYYENNLSAVKLQIVQPILTQLGWDFANPEMVIPEHRVGQHTLDYAFFKEGTLNGFLLTTYGELAQDISMVRKICKYLDSDKVLGGIVTNGFNWTFIDKEGYIWTFQTDDEGCPERFLPNILFLTPQNIDNLGSQIKLISKAGKANRMGANWLDFTSQNHIIEKLEVLKADFRGLVRNSNQDIELENTEIDQFFENGFVFLVKNNTPNSVLKVTMPDGKIILNKEAKRVFLKTIAYLGIQRIKKYMNLEVGSKNGKDGSRERLYLIEESPAGKTQEKVEENGKVYYIFTGTNNKTKFEQLKKFKHLPQNEGMIVKQLWV